MILYIQNGMIAIYQEIDLDDNINILDDNRVKIPN